MTKEESSLDVLHISEIDIDYEEDLLRNPFNLKSWLRYIQHKSSSGYVEAVFYLYERALLDLPRSYKLWKRYLDLRVDHCISAQFGNSGEWPLHENYAIVNECFERALLILGGKMPRIWIDYVEFLLKQGRITLTRRTLNRALKALPITQHERIWALYLKFIKKADISELSVRVYQRYLKLFPEKIEEYIDYLKYAGKFNDAAKNLLKVINDPGFKSIKEGKTKYAFWMELCDLICKHPKEMKGFNVEPILRSGISKFKDQLGKLWISLAEYFILMGHLHKARNIYEEGLKSVFTVRDFTQVFDVYAKFEEAIIAKLIKLSENSEDDLKALDFRMAYFENLMERRPYLLNDVVLRQNPNNVHEWLKRIEMCMEAANEKMILESFERATTTIDPKRVQGKFPEIWVKYALYKAKEGDVEAARSIFERATTIDYRTVDDLCDLWIAYSNFELEHSEKKAIEIMVRATKPQGRTFNVDYRDDKTPTQIRLFKSVKLWQHYIDLEEALGTFASTKAVYDRVLELKIVTPQIIINYGLFLQLHKYFEESFKVYERGIDLFGYPISFEIWNVYLPKFIARYGSSKIERTRDLFEQALDNCPENYAKTIFLMYAKFEEEHGLIRHAMRVFDRAVNAVAKSDRKEIFDIYVVKVAESYGVTATREIYEKAIQLLPNKDAKEMCLSYANLERKLGEIDRARSLYSYASQFSNPKTTPSFWQTWHEFEVAHGNENTYREMLRIKRSVQASYDSKIEVSIEDAKAINIMQAMDGFVPSSKGKKGEEEPEEPATTNVPTIAREPMVNSLSVEEKILDQAAEASEGISEEAVKPILGAKERLLAMRAKNQNQ